MKETTLLKIALAVSMLGIPALFLLSSQIKTDEAMISRLDEMTDETVVVSGMVLDINDMDGTTFILMQKDEMMTVVLFGPSPPLQTGDYIQVRGTVSEHEGETEIIGDEVRVV